MAKTPTKRAELTAVAEKMLAGMETSEVTFPSPPVSRKDLLLAMEDFKKKLAEESYAQSTFKNAVVICDDAFKIMRNAVVDNSEYFRKVAGKNYALYSGLGLTPPSGIKDEPPGQCGELEVLDRGLDYVIFIFKKPVRGGKPLFYRLERMERTIEGVEIWEEVGSSATREVGARNQAAGISYNYRVVAVNREGGGIPSNTINIRF